MNAASARSPTRSSSTMAMRRASFLSLRSISPVTLDLPLIGLDDFAHPVRIGQSSGYELRAVAGGVELDGAGAEHGAEQRLVRSHGGEALADNLRALLAQQSFLVQYVAVGDHQPGRLVLQMPDQKNDDADANCDQQQGQNDAERVVLEHYRIGGIEFLHGYILLV